MDELEKQRIFFPKAYFSLNRETEFGESQTERDSQPARDSLRESQKRRRIGSGPNSNLDSLSLTPTLSANVQVQAAFHEDPNRSLPSPPDHYRYTSSRNASSLGVSQQETRDQRLLLANLDQQCAIDGRQTAYSLPQIAEDESHPCHLNLTGPPDFADVEALSYSLPSFNAISEIPFLPLSEFSAPQETVVFPSPSLDYSIPSFSQMTVSLLHVTTQTQEFKISINPLHSIESSFASGIFAS
ncbi:unnamed protein product [Penicillium roqueforti FM164]|uniref:Genomic scaffold, ProqFM164S01 n=1 Tax=Penicillium roqueforti (strain FM164) TaxID=1365484 RepID=W6Q4H4_PENRF|nr:unnamed protein product [Penicillium roqueforti FM164]